MESKETIDAGFTENIVYQLKSDRKQYLKRIGTLIVVNTLLFGLLIKGIGTFTDTLLTAFNANMIGFNIFGFILGSIVALFPYKGLPYNKKYLRASLLTIMTIQFIMTAVLIIIGLMTLMGWY